MVAVPMYLWRQSGHVSRPARWSLADTARWVAVATGFGDVAGLVERVAVDEGFVGVGDVDVALGDVADDRRGCRGCGRSCSRPGLAGAGAFAAG